MARVKGSWYWSESGEKGGKSVLPQGITKKGVICMEGNSTAFDIQSFVTLEDLFKE